MPVQRHPVIFGVSMYRKDDEDQHLSFGVAVLLGLALAALALFLAFTVLVEDFFRFVLRRPRKGEAKRKKVTREA